MQATRDRPASYIIHAPFSLARLGCERGAGMVTCEARVPSSSKRASLSAPYVSSLARTLIATCRERFVSSAR